jgi:hypothetical protein
MENQEEPKIIHKKNGIEMIKQKENNYQMHFLIENKLLQLEKVINLDLCKIIYEINKDFLEDFYLLKKDENNATIYYLFKHFFQDFGLTQKYTYINILMKKTDNQIVFTTENNNEKIMTEIKIVKNSEILPIKKATIICSIINPHKTEITNTILFESNKKLPSFVEKFATNFFSKIFIRIKQFI